MNGYGILLCVALLLMALLLAIRRWVDYRLRRRHRLMLLYLRTLMAMCCGRWRIYGFRFIETPEARMALAEALAGVRRTLVDCDPALLRSVARSYDLERMLLRRLRLHGMRRRALELLAELPLSRETARRIEQMEEPRGRSMRFLLLRARINASPARSMEWLRRFRDRLTMLECRELTSMLLRGSLSVAYGPLLMAPEENLRRIGLCLVRHFGIEQAVGQVRRLATDPRVGREALQVLCDLHHPMPELAVAPLTPAERRMLLRRAAVEGYAPEGLNPHLTAEERLRFERLASTYTTSSLWS